MSNGVVLPASLPASYICAGLALGLLAIHFNAEVLPAWTPSLSSFAAAVALAGAALAALSLGRRGWWSLRHWGGQVALALREAAARATIAQRRGRAGGNAR